MSRCAMALMAIFAVGQGLAVAAEVKVAPQDPARVRRIAALLRPEAGFAETRIGNRAVWNRLAALPRSKGVKARGDALISTPLVVPDDAKYREIYPWARPLRKMVDQMAELVLIECLTNEGRYLPRIVETLEMLSKMRTWVNPYHDRKFGSFEGQYKMLELNNGMASQSVALTLDVLRDVLPPDVRARALAALRRQTLDVYLEIARDGAAATRNRCSFYSNTFNWCAACNEFFTSAALLALDDPMERATAIELAERSTQCYLSGFTAEGLCREGASYWDFGFGQYLRLGIQVLRATDGRYSIMPEERAKSCMRSGFETAYNDNGVPAYGDCGHGKTGFEKR